MLWLGGFDLTRWSFVSAKLWIGILVILPMEVIDIHLSHLGGNKARIRRSGEPGRYERTMARPLALLPRHRAAGAGADPADVRARDREAVLTTPRDGEAALAMIHELVHI